MDSLVQIIAVLVFALVSIIANERTRKKRIEQQRQMHPPARPRNEPAFEIVEPDRYEREDDSEDEAEPRTAQEMMRRLRENVQWLQEPAPKLAVLPPAPEWRVPERPGTTQRTVPLSAPLLARELRTLKMTSLGQPQGSPSRRTPPSGRVALLKDLRTAEGLRRAVLMREILGPPRAYQDHGR